MGRLCSSFRSQFQNSGHVPGWQLLLLASMALAGCSRGMDIRTDDQTRIIPTEQAFALPEVGGPPVTAVLEKRYANATEHDVLLATSAATPGQNMLRIQVFGPVDTGLAGQQKLRAGFLPAKNVNAEMRALIPGVRMKTSALYVQNKYGPFGYASARTASGDTCFYGWQRIASTGFTQTWIGNKGSIQVRLRLCDQNASEGRLLEAMYGYTINASFKDKNWNPYGEPLPPDVALGRPGAPMYPTSGAYAETTGAIAEPAPKRVSTTKSPRASTVTQAPARQPAPTGPMVPAPPGDEIVSSPGTRTPVADAAPLVPPPPCLPGDAKTPCN